MNYYPLLFFVLLLVGCTTRMPGSAVHSAGTPADSAAIAAIVADLDSAWADGDADRWIANYALDAEFINILGMLMEDVGAVRDRHDQIFRTVFRGSTYRSTLRSLRFLRPDAAIADADITVTGFAALPPGARPTEPGVLRTRMRHVLQRIDGRWWIVASQNTAVAPEVVGRGGGHRIPRRSSGRRASR